MCKKQTVRSSWEFVVVGLNFFYCFTPTLGLAMQVSVATLMGLRISEAL